MVTQLEPVTAGGDLLAQFKRRIPSQEELAEMMTRKAMITGRWATYEFFVRFLSPLMMDRMTDRQIEGLVTGQSVSWPKDEAQELKAQRKIYSEMYDDAEMPAGAIGIPQINLYACLRDAGESVKWGSGAFDKITQSTKGTKLYKMIRLHEEVFAIVGPDGKPAPWKTDRRKGNATQGTGAVGIIRPRFDECGFFGHVDLNLDLLSETKLVELFRVAGVDKGLCSARPAKKMPFGMFALTEPGLKWVAGADPKKSSAAPPADPDAKPAAKRGRKKADPAVEAAPAESLNGDGHKSEDEGESEE